jgi:glutathione S-transferase
MKVYGVSLSPFVRKVLLTLETKGIAYQQISVMPGQTPADYDRISPLRKVPALDHDGFIVADSTVICSYLDDVFPEKPVYPKDPKQRATARFLEEFGDTRLIENIAPIFRERMVKPILMKQPTDETLVKNLVDNVLPPILAYLEGVVPEKGFLFGAAYPGVADFGIASPLLNGQYGGFEVDGRTYPKLATYFGRVAATPVVTKRLETERKEMAAIRGST